MSDTLAGVSAGRLVRRNHGSGHSYRFDGEKLDGVTTLLGDGMRKRALEEWAGNVTADYAIDHWEVLTEMPYSQRLATLRKARYEVRDAAARRGSEVHRLAEQLVRGIEVAVPDEIAGYVAQAVRFLDEWQVHHLVSESPGCNVELRYAGTLDLIFTSELFPGRVFLADWKTGKGVYGDTALQLEAYSRFDFLVDEHGSELPMDQYGVTDHVVVHVRSDGYSVVGMESGDRVWDTFQAVAECARRTRGDELTMLRGDELYLPGRTS